MGKIEKLIKKLCSTGGKVSYEKIVHTDMTPDFVLVYSHSKVELTIYTYEDTDVELVLSECDFGSPISVYRGNDIDRAFRFMTKFFTEEVMDVINTSLDVGIGHERESVAYVLQLMFPDYQVTPYYVHEYGVCGYDEFCWMDPVLQRRLRIVVGPPYIEYDWLNRV